MQANSAAAKIGRQRLRGKIPYMKEGLQVSTGGCLLRAAAMNAVSAGEIGSE